MYPAVDLVDNISLTGRKFRRACKQIILLNQHISDLKHRYNRAAKMQRKSFRCSLRLRMATYEGVRNMIYEYATRCLEDIERMKFILQVDSYTEDSNRQYEPDSDGQ